MLNERTTLPQTRDLIVSGATRHDNGTVSEAATCSTHDFKALGGAQARYNSRSVVVVNLAILRVVLSLKGFDSSVCTVGGRGTCTLSR